MRATKDSGVKWLGEIPSDWDVVPARALFSNPSEPNKPDDVHLTPSQKYGVLPQEDYMELSGSRVVLNLSGADNMRHVNAGDYISHLRSFQGGLEFSGFDGKVSAAYTVLRPRCPIDAGYFKHLFKSTMYVQGLQTTTDQLRDGQSIRFGQFSLLALPNPPLEEQHAIADFLDRETAKIDKLIAKQEQLISTLGERRAAVVISAVTSKSPAWTLERVGSLTRVLNGFPFDSETFGMVGDVPLVRIRDIFSSSFTTFVPLGSVPENAWIRNDDIVIGMDGDFNLRLWTRGPAALNQRVCVLRSSSPIMSRWLAYCLPHELQRINDLTYATTVKHLASSQVSRIKISVPPDEELEQTVRKLDRETDRIDLLMLRAKEMNKLLIERRQSLISAAVTGKLEVGV